MTNSSLPAAPDSAASTPPEKIEARPLRHPWRWVFATLLALLAVWFIISSARNEAFGWGTYFQYLFDTRIATAALHTIAITILAMIIGVVGGAALAVMRMSPNPVLGGVSWVYLWLFRGTPIYVQLVFWGLLSALYQSINLGFAEISLTEVLTNAFLLSVLGLGLNEAAYMAEIVRSGISSVPEGQKEASKALGMGWWMTMRRTVLPQAMRIIIPPTGNEFISAQNFLPCGCYSLHGRNFWPRHGYLGCALRAHSASDGGRDVVPGYHLSAHGGPVLLGAPL